MRIIATKHRQWKNDNGVGYVTLRVPNYGHYKKLGEVPADEKISVTVEKASGGRTLEQNRKMWALINDIDKATNGYLSNDPMGIYINALREAGAKSVMVIALTETEKELRKVFRAVEFMQPVEGDKAVYRCYPGSSTFTKKEMSDLIEVLLNMAADAGLNVGYWGEVLR